MGWDRFVALFLFIAVAGLTPGPNNIIAMTIGFNHGFKKVTPHLFGVLVGFPVMLILIGLVLKPIMDRYHEVYMFLKIISITYIIYLAFRIATTPINQPIDSDRQRAPISFWESVAFQWINPKAWAGAITTVTVYMAPDHFASSLAVAVVLSMISIFTAITLWALLGKQIGRFLSHPMQMRIFNLIMALLLLVAVGMMVF